MLAETLEDLRRLAARADSWVAKLPFNISTDSSKPKIVDLVPFLLPNKYDEKQKASLGYPLHTRFKFPSCYQGITAKEALEKDICSSALQYGGQNIIVRSFDQGPNCMSKQRVAIIRFQCHRHQVMREGTERNFSSGKCGADGIVRSHLHQSHAKKPRPKKYKTTSTKPIAACDRCSFGFSAILAHDNYWYLPVIHRRASSGFSDVDPTIHIGHPFLEPEETHPSTSRLPPEELELQKVMDSAGVSHPEQARVISERTGQQWTAHQMRHLSNKERDLVSGLTGNASSADRLVASFRER